MYETHYLKSIKFFLTNRLFRKNFNFVHIFNIILSNLFDERDSHHAEADDYDGLGGAGNWFILLVREHLWRNFCVGRHEVKKKREKNKRERREISRTRLHYVDVGMVFINAPRGRSEYKIRREGVHQSQFIRRLNPHTYPVFIAIQLSFRGCLSRKDLFVKQSRKGTDFPDRVVGKRFPFGSSSSTNLRVR